MRKQRKPPVNRPLAAVAATLFAGLTVLAGACTGGEVESVDEMNPLPGPRTNAGEAMAPAAEPMAPDTTAEAVQAYLEAQEYAATWAMWPGTEAYYPGTEPHGVLLTTYLNPDAAEGVGALMASRGTETDFRPSDTQLPYGSIVVKENYAPDSTLAAVTVMYKVAGFDPEHGDWWWMKRLADGTVEAAGRVESCIDCHSENAGLDYLMTVSR